ncbi:MAG: hypothetical protein ACTHXI_04730 [Halomonadaceae bacterium]
MALIRWLLAALLITTAMTTAMTLSSTALAGGIEVRDFDNPVQKERYRDLTSSMRCASERARLDELINRKRSQ